MAALTVSTILLGDGTNSSDMDSWAVDPSLAEVACAAATSTTGGDTWVNNGDRRNFIWFRNAGANVTRPHFVINYSLGSASGAPHAGVGGGDSATKGHYVGGSCAAGETRLYGPFPSHMFNDSSGLATVKAYDVTVGAYAEANQKVAAMYLPFYDDIAGTFTDVDDVALPAGATPVALMKEVQSINMSGLAPTFYDHDETTSGFGFRVSEDSKSTNGWRRFLWVRNNTVQDNIPLIFIGSYWGNSASLSTATTSTPWGMPSSEDTLLTDEFAFNTASMLIDAGEEYFIGSFDPRVWNFNGTFRSLDFTNAFSVRVNADVGVYTVGTTPLLDFAWIELPL